MCCMCVLGVSCTCCSQGIITWRYREGYIGIVISDNNGAVDKKDRCEIKKGMIHRI